MVKVFLGTKNYSARSFCHLSFCPFVILSLWQWWQSFCEQKIIVLGHSATCHFAQLSFCQNDILLFWTKCGARSFSLLSFCQNVIFSSSQLLFSDDGESFLGTKNYSARSFCHLSFCQIVILTMVKVFLGTKNYGAKSFCHLSFCQIIILSTWYFGISTKYGWC